MSNYDAQFLFLMSQGGGSLASRVKGLLVFNQDTSLVRKPDFNEKTGEVSVLKETKVLLHHLSVLDESALDEYIDLGLDYIWKTMHCTSIKVQLHHFLQDDEKNPGTQKLKGNETLKGIFKKRVFRWKTLKNEKNGLRIEIMEGPNCHFKEQLKPSTAFIYRRGLQKGDIAKDTVNIKITNSFALAPPTGQAA